jgi:hypothetical protein
VFARDIVVGNDQVAQLAAAELENAATRGQRQFAPKPGPCHDHKPWHTPRELASKMSWTSRRAKVAVPSPERRLDPRGQVALETQLDAPRWTTSPTAIISATCGTSRRRPSHVPLALPRSSMRYPLSA